MRHFDDANLWSGVYRMPDTYHSGPVPGDWTYRGLPTVVATLRLRYWSLPLSVSIGGHLLSRPGLTFGIGPVYISWSIL